MHMTPEQQNRIAELERIEQLDPTVCAHARWEVQEAEQAHDKAIKAAPALAENVARCEAAARLLYNEGLLTEEVYARAQKRNDERHDPGLPGKLFLKVEQAKISLYKTLVEVEAERAGAQTPERTAS
jgi:hypothetical protein